MKPEIVKLWVEALRSGEYKQGFGQLRVEDEFCCLGVACDLALKHGVKVEVDTEKYGERMCTRYDMSRSVLPIAVKEWLGAGDTNPYLPAELADEFNLRKLSLAALNDDGASFDDIAYYIERAWLKEPNGQAKEHD